MLSTYLKRPHTLERYHSGPAGPHLDPFTGWLEARGYQSGRIRRLLHGLQHFSLWAQEAGLTSQEFDAKALEAFRRRGFTLAFRLFAFFAFFFRRHGSALRFEPHPRQTWLRSGSNCRVGGP